MARSLRQQPPSSSFARLLDPTAAARATAQSDDERKRRLDSLIPPQRTEDRTQRTSDVAQSDSKRPRRIKREILLCPETDEVLDEIVRVLRLGTRARVTTSHVARALLKAISPSLDAIRSQAAELGPRRLPSNAAGGDDARREFEAAIAATFADAFRRE